MFIANTICHHGYQVDAMKLSLRFEIQYIFSYKWQCSYYVSDTCSFLPALSSRPSMLISGTLGVTLFAGMQMFRQQLASTEYFTILGGFLGSVLFILALTVSLNIRCIWRWTCVMYVMSQLLCCIQSFVMQWSITLWQPGCFGIHFMKFCNLEIQIG